MPGVYVPKDAAGKLLKFTDYATWLATNGAELPEFSSSFFRYTTQSSCEKLLGFFTPSELRPKNANPPLQ